MCARLSGGVPVSLPVVRRGAGVRAVGRVSRPVAREIAAARGTGEISEAMVRSLGRVTHVAVSLAAMLTAEEERLVTICPLGEARYKALVDQFTAAAATEIARMAW